ncbi:cation:proton antiporter [Streptomyces sp. NPDC046237]|uniref:cation:proton antiporter domain-containing protein n=1 Tax=Streptomyces sp. NPDC046237 TaxID=3154914 RepID=UPI0034079485
MSHSGATLILIMSIAVLAPLLAYAVGRRLPVPLVVFEILLGILVGPDVLGWAYTGPLIDGLSELGLAMLIFLAGYEIEFGKVRGDTLRRSVGAWLVALALGLGAGVLLGDLRPRPPWFSRIIARTMHTSGQFAVRFVFLLLALMLGASQALGLDVLLGAFAAGLITRLVLTGAAPESGPAILEKVEAVGFGFLVPVFFVVTGIEFDLDSLLDGGRTLLLLPVFLLLFVVLRGGPVWFLAPGDLVRRDRSALVLYESTALPLVVAVTTIGLDDKALTAGEAAALVGAGMLSVLVLPILAMKIRAKAGGAPGAGVREAVTGSESW